MLKLTLQSLNAGLPVRLKALARGSPDKHWLYPYPSSPQLSSLLHIGKEGWGEPGTWVPVPPLPVPTVCSSLESLRVPTGWRDKDWRGALCRGDGLCQGRVVWRGAGRAPWEE